MTRLAACAALLSGLLGLAGCAGPDPVLYTLAAQSAAPAAAPARTKIHSLELRRIGLPGYLDRPGIVRSATAYRLDVTQDARWAAPLGPMLQGVIAEDLVMRLPGISVFTETAAISTQPDRVLRIDIQRLDADPTGEVVLAAQAALSDGNSLHPAAVRSFRITQRPAFPVGEDPVAAQVAAMSLAVAGMTDELARMLR
jgi:uncharacterized lipoprotein YmbA